jgi:ArsR family transcriptional regulator
MVINNPNARALSALGHDSRLSIFRLLVKAGEQGLRISDIEEHLSLAPSTLVHHLSTLVSSGLILQEKQGREVLNRVDYLAMENLIGFLTSECCVGVVVGSAEEVS